MNIPEYRKVQGLVGEQSFSIVLPKQYAVNLGIALPLIPPSNEQ
jgi:hypothetical protein